MDRLKEMCGHCGCTLGSHHGGSYPWPYNYCPGHEGRMDWDKGPGTTFLSTGIYKEDKEEKDDNRNLVKKENKKMREKTNSITHLVKTVAGEVFDEKMKQKMTEYPDCPRKYFQSHFASERAGESWTQIEDDLLVQEVDSTLNRIATKHGRTIGAIRSRISQRGIF